MDRKHILQKIGYLFFGIGVISRLIYKFFGNLAHDIFKYGVFLVLFGLLLWLFGYVLLRLKAKSEKKEM